MRGYLRAEQRSTRQRQAVLQALQACPDFVSARSLHAAVEAADVVVGLTTVYRTLHLLEETGHVDVVRTPNGERLYRPRPGDGHRHYAVCRECGLSVAVEAERVEQWAEETAARTGFTQVGHTIELVGICPDCSRAQRGH